MVGGGLVAHEMNWVGIEGGGGETKRVLKKQQDASELTWNTN
jgi:hypothetical protein